MVKQLLFYLQFTFLFTKIFSDAVYKKFLNLYFLKQNDAFYEAEFNIEVANFNEIILSLDSLPSDLVDNFRKIPLKHPIEISLTQGQLELFNKDGFSEFKSLDKKIKRNNNFRLSSYSGRFDQLFDSVGTNMLFNQEIVNSREDIINFNTLLDSFAALFKIPKFYFSDLTNAIKFSFKNENLIYMNDYIEKPCIDNIEGIKKLFPFFEWEFVKTMVNYQSFVDSDFKTIKYTFQSINNTLVMNFKLSQYIELEEFFKYYSDKYDMLRTIPVRTYSLTKEGESKVQEFTNLVSEIDISSEHNYEAKHVTNLVEGYGISSSRNLKGSVFGFENFEMVHDISIRQTQSNLSKKILLKFVDLIPEQFDILLSTVKINYEVYDNRGAINTIYYFDYKNFRHFLNISFNLTEMQHPVLWTYDKRRKFFVNFENISLLPNSRLKISYELRKRMINFESYDNELEFGYKIPSGVLVYSYEKSEEMLHITDQIYFNIPTIDNTMPFNIIALCFVTIGVFLIQTLNLFMGDKSKSLLEQIKDKMRNLYEKMKRDYEKKE